MNSASTRPLLFIGNRNYSSWSLRAYLALAAGHLEHDTELIVLDQPSSKDDLARLTPAARVPALRIGDDFVWESLAIAEWAAERAPSLWPADSTARAHARSAAAEMHAGFAAVRRDMPMNIRGRHPGVGHSTEALSEVERITKLWREARDRFAAGGSFLYGDTFTVADAMFAPVATRFVTYNVLVDDDSARYIDAVVEFPPMAEWTKAAAVEPHVCNVAEPSSPAWQGGPLA